jgi:hypothetical protein
MRSYVATTGVLFGLLTIAHIWRIFAEGRQVLDVWWIGITLVAAGLCLWAVRLLTSPPRA